MNTPTRKDYINDRVSFSEFYRAINATAKLVVRDSAFLDRVRGALDAGDEHLNAIPLAVWDRLALANRLAIARALRQHGDFYSMAGGVCAMKQAARDAVS